MTDSNPTGHSTSGKQGSQGSQGADSLEEAAQDGPLPETENIDAAAEAGRDNSEAEDPGDNRDTDPIAGGGILGGISQSR
ncbi:MAG TPA: hypothetical protein VGB75_06570 [Jatrophihabitans sp.]|uniref:hypothetical protein n=1 Tax=Jatrophihabitans sp. TaxID=1932789 RepID=UPI002EDC2712